MKVLRQFPVLLAAAYLVFSAALGIAPFDRAVWWAENIPLFLIAGTLSWMYVRGERFSNAAYIMMSVLLFMHTVGGHFTFERVPFDFVTKTFGFERNHYDRIAHFSVGFYAFAIAEILERRALVTRRWVAITYAIFAIGTIAALYEIIEWIYAALEGGDAGAAFLGSQGDIWDAQKDMLADTLGALFASVIYALSAGRFVPGASEIDPSKRDIERSEPS